MSFQNGMRQNTTFGEYPERRYGSAEVLGLQELAHVGTGTI